MDRDIIFADHGTFCWFLRWLVENEVFTGEDIIYVVEKRWKWQPEFEKFLDATADER